MSAWIVTTLKATTLSHWMIQLPWLWPLCEALHFVGRDALSAVKQNGPAEKLVAFRMTGKGPPPRPHYAVYADGARIGEVTSGTLSPSLNYGVGMAYVGATVASPGRNIEIEIRGTRFPATIEKKPLYKKQS